MARVVVVEDDADIAMLIAHKLRTAGHDVVVEADGEAGLAAVRAELPDLVVLDWTMPRMNGIDVCRAIRSDPHLAGTRVLMLTARAQESDPGQSRDAGADEYMRKPFSTRELVSHVEALIARG